MSKASAQYSTMPEMESNFSTELSRKECLSSMKVRRKNASSFDLDLETAKYSTPLSKRCSKNYLLGQLLDAAVAEASELGQTQEWSEGAWVLRHCFDDILDGIEHQAAHGTFLLAEAAADTDSSNGYTWQDEEMKISSDIEKCQTIADIAYILRVSITPKTHTSYTK